MVAKRSHLGSKEESPAGHDQDATNQCLSKSGKLDAPARSIEQQATSGDPNSLASNRGGQIRSIGDNVDLMHDTSKLVRTSDELESQEKVEHLRSSRPGPCAKSKRVDLIECLDAQLVTCKNHTPDRCPVKVDQCGDPSSTGVRSSEKFQLKVECDTENLFDNTFLNRIIGLGRSSFVFIRSSLVRSTDSGEVDSPTEHEIGPVGQQLDSDQELSKPANSGQAALDDHPSSDRGPLLRHASDAKSRTQDDQFEGQLELNETKSDACISQPREAFANNKPNSNNNSRSFFVQAFRDCMRECNCGSCIRDRYISNQGSSKEDGRYLTKEHLKYLKSSTITMDHRRSTYSSSAGLPTDMPCDSSLSSFNNCPGNLIDSYGTTLTDSVCPKHPGLALNKSGRANKGSNQCDLFSHCSKETNESVADATALDMEPTGRRPKGHDSRRTSLKKRENWDKNIEFLLAVIGFAVDLGNVWRFPYICYKNGGGAFLIPYTVMFILGGLPIFYLELSLGQYFSSGCLTVWRRVCPMAKGIGYAMCVLNFFTGLYYNTIISWAVFFFVQSFTPVLPWTSCNNTWNSLDCKTIEDRQINKAKAEQIFALGMKSSLSSQNQTVVGSFSRPTKDYFEREVLQQHLSTGIDDLGSIRWPLAIYLAIVFICIYFAIWKGVKSTGKPCTNRNQAVWITALLPYFVLIPLLFRGIFLEGAWLGISYYLSPQWSKIMDVDVWVEAAKQIYFSLGPGFGTLMALSSYNKFNHNCRKDALIAASVNYFASFIAGLVIFAVLGYMATIEDVSISSVATEGPGLVFQVYPEGLATMRYSSMWSVLFFIMVITLGIDSTFGGLESVITGLCDEYPRVLRAHRGVFIGLLIILIYICSLPTTTYGGNYVIYLLESYGTSLSLLFIVLVETIIVCWLYGTDRFCENLKEMYGEMPGPYWRICWKYISPSILLVIFVAACGQELEKYRALSFELYNYPSWAPRLGLLMTGSSVCCIPIYAIYYIRTKTTGSFSQRLRLACTPLDVVRKDDEVYKDGTEIRDDKSQGDTDI